MTFRTRMFLKRLGITLLLLALLIALICGNGGGLWWLAMLMIGLSGCILSALGIVGEYIARIYDETRGRPLYIVADAVGFERENA